MEDNKDRIYYINVEEILPNRFQPRLAFDEKELNDLSNSILKYGVIQPIVVRKISDKYEIIAGERRYKAACLAGLKTIPAIINNTDDNTSAEIALLENLQRKNLSVIEEAQSYKKLLDKGFTQEEIANKLSISQSSIANRLRLLTLPKEVKDALLYNRISERHARSLLTLNNPDLQRSLLNKIVSEKLTVRQTEDEISLMLKKTDNYIPDEIQRFLNPQSNQVAEPIVESPQVVNNTINNTISDSYVPAEEPKQDDIEFVEFDAPQAVVEVNEEDNNVNNDTMVESKYEDTQINPFQVSNTSVNVFSDAKTDLSKSPDEISKDIEELIRNYANNNSKIQMNKLELLDKYQIIIDINKY